jgi:hypothetical protein
MDTLEVLLNEAEANVEQIESKSQKILHAAMKYFESSSGFDNPKSDTRIMRSLSRESKRVLSPSLTKRCLVSSRVHTVTLP